jgi:hypothetical protein
MVVIHYVAATPLPIHAAIRSVQGRGDILPAVAQHFRVSEHFVGFYWQAPSVRNMAPSGAILFLIMRF